jgi:hypothetical protein
MNAFYEHHKDSIRFGYRCLGALAGAWPIVGRAQQKAVRLIGFLSGVSPQTYTPFVAAFRAGRRARLLRLIGSDRQAALLPRNGPSQGDILANR